MVAIARRVSGILMMLGFVSLQLHAQGLYWETTINALEKDISQTYYMPGMLKDVSGEEVTILRLDRGAMYELYPSRKQYSEMTFAEMETEQKEANKKMKESMEEMKKYLENLPADQRKQMEGMMGDQMAGLDDAKMEIKVTGERKSISGFDCVRSNVLMNGKLFMTIWTSKDVPGYAAMQKDYYALSQRLASMSPQGTKMVEAMKKMDGFMIHMEMGKEMNMTVTKVEKRSIPASEFEIPAGYKKVKAKESKRQRGNPLVPEGDESDPDEES
jgi:GLPGLI family protein